MNRFELTRDRLVSMRIRAFERSTPASRLAAAWQLFELFLAGVEPDVREQSLSAARARKREELVALKRALGRAAP